MDLLLHHVKYIYLKFQAISTLITCKLVIYTFANDLGKTKNLSTSLLKFQHNLFAFCNYFSMWSSSNSHIASRLSRVTKKIEKS